MKTNTKKNTAWQAYNAAREDWLKAILSNRRLSPRAKITASAMFFYFNQERFNREGYLWAWCGLRTLDRETGQDRKTVVLAIDDLEAAGYLKVYRQYDPVEKRHHNHRYLALVPTKAAQKPAETGISLGGGGGNPAGGVVETGGPGVVETGGPYSMNNSMKEDSMNNIPLASLAECSGKKEAGERGLRPREQKERPCPTRQTPSLEPNDGPAADPNSPESKARVAAMAEEVRRIFGPKKPWQ